jgi:hypothetical protein
MNQLSRGFLNLAAASTLAVASLAPTVLLAQNDTPKSSGKSDQWIHVRIDSKENKGEMVRVNVPLEMAEKVLPAINKDNLRNGKVHIDSAHVEDVDFRALLDAVRTSRDGEYVTIQSNENDVRVAKSEGYLLVHITDKSKSKHLEEKDARGKVNSERGAKVEVKIPMKVVDALFSAGKDELDIVAALHALSAHGDTDLVTIKDSDNTIHVWIDSKSATN